MIPGYTATSLRTNNVAKRLNRTTRMVRLYAAKGQLRAIKVGKLWFFEPADVEEFRRRLAGVEERAA